MMLFIRPIVLLNVIVTITRAEWQVAHLNGTGDVENGVTSSTDISATTSTGQTSKTVNTEYQTTTVNATQNTTMTYSYSKTAIPPRLELNWCICTTGVYPNFRHYISCRPEDSFMQAIGLDHGDELVLFHLAFTNIFNHVEMMRLLIDIQPNETFELIYRKTAPRGYTGLPSKYANAARGWVRLMRDIVARYEYTYVRASFQVTAAPKAPRTRRQIEPPFHVVIQDKQGILSGQTVFHFPPVPVVIGTNSEHFVCNNGSLSACDLDQVFERLIMINLTSEVVYSRFCVPSTSLFITAVGPSNVAIGTSNSISASFEVIPVNTLLRIYSLLSEVFPSKSLYETEEHEIKMQSLSSMSDTYDARFNLWYFKQYV